MKTIYIASIHVRYKEVSGTKTIISKEAFTKQWRAESDCNRLEAEVEEDISGPLTYDGCTKKVLEINLNEYTWDE